MSANRLFQMVYLLLENGRLTAGELAEKLRALGCAAECCTSIPEGVAAAQGAAGYDGRVCALGTLYFSGDVRRAFEHSL